MPADWTQPPFADRPGNLAGALAGATLTHVENDRATRRVALRFDLAADAGTPEAHLVVTEATHLLAFAYLPPSEALPEGLSPEEAMAAVGDWARRGLVTMFDPVAAETPLVVARAFLHRSEAAATLSVEGYGEDPDRLVWWELRVSGRSVEVEGSDL